MLYSCRSIACYIDLYHYIIICMCVRIYIYVYIHMLCVYIYIYIHMYMSVDILAQVQPFGSITLALLRTRAWVGGLGNGASR